MHALSWWVLAAGCLTDAEVQRALDQDGDGFLASGGGGADCNDGDANVYPGADERCDDRVDNNCDGVIDDFGLGDVLWYADADLDGYGSDSSTRRACLGWPEAATGRWSREGGDCDDDDPAVKPGAFEACDGVDNDCDDEVDESVATTPDDVVYPTIAAGIAAAIASGQPLSVCAGDHTVSTIRIGPGASLQLRGAGVDRTALTSGSTVFDIDGGSLTVSDVTMTGGSLGLVAEGSATLDVRDSAFTDTPTAVRLWDGVQATFTDTAFTDDGQSGSGHGGLVTRGGVDVTLTRCRFANNHGEHGGGLIHTAGLGAASLLVIDSAFEGNAAVRGGGVFADLSAGSQLELRGVTLSSNEATEGGAAYLSGAVILSGTDVTANTASVGAGLYVAGGDVLVDADCAVTRNEAALRSGAAHVSGTGRLTFEGADVGAGLDDNTPQDVQSAYGGVDSSLGSAAWALCEPAGCSPL